MNPSDLLKSAATVTPSPRQMRWYDTEFYVFVHFTVNTYTDNEWGDGTEDPAIFDPVRFDPDQWVSAVKSAGAKALIFTAKHHDGFCLWPSAYTEHSIKNSPFRNGQGDMVREVAEACRRGGIRFGFYLSPWDRHEPSYGMDAYNDFYCHQLVELLTGYGDIFMVWLDGACGEGPNGKKQELDFHRIISLVRQYQPNACIFNDRGPDVRWCGNEAGTTRFAEWAVVPGALCPLAEATPVTPLLQGSLAHMYNTQHDIGSLSNILYADSLAFCGSEVDMSIRPGWFWHPQEEPHSLARLFDTYLRTVGGNCCLHLNIPPNRDGLFDDRDVQRLQELGDLIRSKFGADKQISAAISREDISSTQFALHSAQSDRPVEWVVLAEDIARGQRIESFLIQRCSELGKYSDVYCGTTVGHKRICRLPRPVPANELRIVITAARDTVYLNPPVLFTP